MIRPMLPEDVAASQQVTARALNTLFARTGDPVQEQTDQAIARGRRRIAHLQQTDPGSAWVAEVDGEVVGCSLALVRDGMWFLSLLMVDPPQQGTGLGRGLLRAALTTATERSWILSTTDPSALRGYQREGFALHPSYTAQGPVDRSKIPAVQGIREVSYDDDRDLIESVALACRGARLGPEVDYLRGGDGPVLVDASGNGFVVLRPDGVGWLAATDEETARRLLWTALAADAVEMTVDWLTGQQQWAIDVCQQAGLPLKGGASICLRGQPQASPYLPSGAFG